MLRTAYSQENEEREREGSFLLVVGLMQTHKWAVYREGDPGSTRSSVDVFISSLLPASGIYVEKDLEGFQEAEVADDSKQTVFYRHRWTEVHINSQRPAAHTRPG